MKFLYRDAVVTCHFSERTPMDEYIRLHITDFPTGCEHWCYQFPNGLGAKVTREQGYSSYHLSLGVWDYSELLCSDVVHDCADDADLAHALLCLERAPHGR